MQFDISEDQPFESLDQNGTEHENGTLDAINCSHISKDSDQADQSFRTSKDTSVYISTCPEGMALSSQEEASLWFDEPPDVSAEEEASFLFEVSSTATSN
jgi:hypothetical protein